MQTTYTALLCYLSSSRLVVVVVMVVVVVVVVVVVDLREDRNINSSNKYLTTLVVHFFHCFVSLNVEQCIKTEFQNFFQEELCMS